MARRYYEETTFEKLTPFIILLVVVGILTAIGLAVNSVVTSIARGTKEELSKRNINISSGGASIGVKDRTEEELIDKNTTCVFCIWGPLQGLKLMR